MGLPAAGVGVFAYPHPLHNIFGISELIGYQAPLVFALTWRRDPRVNTVVAVSWIFSVLIWVAILLNLSSLDRQGLIWAYVKPVNGLAQRSLFAGWFGWCAVTGILLFQHARSIGREAQVRKSVESPLSKKDMNKLALALVAINLASFALKAAQPEINPSHIDAYVTPYYDSKGPEVNVGRFSSGLASPKLDDFLTTIGEMKKDWDQLTFQELYVAAIRLYDLGYRKEAVYWFYSAQYRGRQFGVLLDQAKMGSIGSPGFELLHAQNAFYQLVGTYINGYAFGDIDGLVKIVERVQKEGRRIPDLEAAYPRRHIQKQERMDVS